jgi:hypothetical protein
MVDRHREAAGNGSGEGDPTRAGGDDRGRFRRRQIDAPVPGIRPDGGKCLQHGAGDRGTQSGAVGTLGGRDHHDERPGNDDGHDTILSRHRHCAT